MRRLLELMIAALTLAAMPGAPVAMASTDLNDTAWTLAELPGQTLLADRVPTLRLADGRAQGSDGCNRYAAAYRAEGERFELAGDVVATRMACAEPVMQQADAFVAALKNARAARIEDGRLVLLDDAGSVLATLAAQSQELAGTAWRVTGYNNGKQAVVSVLRNTSLTLTFSAEGKVAGSAGCNRYTGTYSASGGKIEIGQVAATRKLCTHPEKVMEQEAAFLKALPGAAVARIEGDRLQLRNAEGALLVSAMRAANDAGLHGPK